MAVYEHDTSITPGKYENLKEACRYAFRAVADSVRVCIPCIVVSYDRKRRMVVVQEAVKKALPKGGDIAYETGVKMKTRVWSPTVGGFSVDIPLFVGDKGWVVVSDVDTSALRKNGGVANDVLDEDKTEEYVTDNVPTAPVSTMTHIPDNGFFIPDNWGDFDVANVKTCQSVVGDGDMYMGSSAKNTCEPLDEDDKPSGSKPNAVDGLASITVSRGTKNGRVMISVGSRAGIIVKRKEVQLVVNKAEKPLASVSLDAESGVIAIRTGSEDGRDSQSITMDATSGETTVNVKSVTIEAQSMKINAQSINFESQSIINFESPSIKIESQSCSLPSSTTVGGKQFSAKAFQ